MSHTRFSALSGVRVTRSRLVQTLGLRANFDEKRRLFLG